MEETKERTESKETKELQTKVFSKSYWKEATSNLKKSHILVFAAIICALRLAVKKLSIPIGAGLFLTFDCYINALGSLVYGPVVALLVGAISDTLGAIIFPKPGYFYFFPYIFVEMSSSFIFALFLWNRKITTPRVLLSKFTVNFISNIVLSSIIQKWYDIYFGEEVISKLIVGTRIVKNLIMFPIESILIVVVLNLLLPELNTLKFARLNQQGIKLTKKDIILTSCLTLLSVGLLIFYFRFFKEFMSNHNFKFW